MTAPDGRLYQADTSSHKCILTLTRCCTQNCSFCAVDAIGPLSASSGLQDCAVNARREESLGRQMSSSEWIGVASKLLALDPYTEFDLSGGDCLALPWVRQKFIPRLLGMVSSRAQVSVTATAASLNVWLSENAHRYSDLLPGDIHITYDGKREYSYENLALAQRIMDLGIDVHVECPLTVDNCEPSMAEQIYTELSTHGISEILLMPFFPVGRGLTLGQSEINEPTPAKYRTAISSFLSCAAQYGNTPRVKLQCALREFSSNPPAFGPCKMGNGTWCVMPDGTVLICPWAYGLNGSALDSSFIAGNLCYQDVWDVQYTAQSQIKFQYQSHFGRCKIKEHVRISNSRFSMADGERDIRAAGADN